VVDPLFSLCGILGPKVRAAPSDIEKNHEYQGWKEKQDDVSEALKRKESHAIFLSV
jgi:hypothetical protein